MGRHSKHREEEDPPAAPSSSGGRSSSRRRRHRPAAPSPPPPAPVSPPLSCLSSPPTTSAAASPLRGFPALTLPALTLPVPLLALPSPHAASPAAPGPIERALQAAGHNLDVALTTALASHSPAAFSSRLGRLDAALVRAGEEMDRAWPGTAERVGSLRRGVGRELERWEAARAQWTGGEVSPYTVGSARTDKEAEERTDKGAEKGAEKETEKGTGKGTAPEKDLPPMPTHADSDIGPDEDDVRSVMANRPPSDGGERCPESESRSSAGWVGDHKRHDSLSSEPPPPYWA